MAYLYLYQVVCLCSTRSLTQSHPFWSSVYACLSTYALPLSLSHAHTHTDGVHKLLPLLDRLLVLYQRYDPAATDVVTPPNTPTAATATYAAASAAQAAKSAQAAAAITAGVPDVAQALAITLIAFVAVIPKPLWDSHLALMCKTDVQRVAFMRRLVPCLRAIAQGAFPRAWPSVQLNVTEVVMMVIGWIRPDLEVYARQRTEKEGEGKRSGVRKRGRHREVHSHACVHACTRTYTYIGTYIPHTHPLLGSSPPPSSSRRYLRADTFQEGLWLAYVALVEAIICTPLLQIETQSATLARFVATLGVDLREQAAKTYWDAW
jgi:hypothetical protein